MSTIASPNAKFLLFSFLFFANCCIGQHLYNEVVPFTTPASWKASWIFHPTANPSAFGVFHFRKRFRLETIPAHFIVHVSGDNRYQLFVNGERVSVGPAKGDVAHWRFQTVDLAPALKKGSNIVAALIWNEGPYLSWSQISFQPGFIMQGNGDRESIINTGSDWKVMENKAYLLPDKKGILSPFERFQAGDYPWGWMDFNYNDQQWPAVQTMELSSVRKLTASTIPVPEESAQRFKSIRRSSGKSVGDGFIKGKRTLHIAGNDSITVLIDQGHLTTAFPELTTSGGKGAVVTITYAEALYDSINGRKGNRNEVQGKQIRGDHDIIFTDGGINRLYRPLYYRTFRYVELKIKTAAQPLVINDFHSVFTAYPFKENAVFKCSDPSLEAIWKTGWRTARLCAYETYMDCPYYEQLQYLGDTRIQALISYAVSGDDRLIRNAIEQFSNSFTEAGLTHARYPELRHQTIPPFSLFWILMVNDYWKYRPDTAFVKHYIDGIVKVLDWHARYIDSNSMLSKMPYWNFVDWPAEWPWTGNENTSGVPAGALTGHSSILTLQYVYALNKAVELFRAFRLDKQATHYEAIAARLKDATFKLCWDSRRGLLANDALKTEYSQHANIMAVLADMLPKDKATALIKRVAADSSIIQCTYYYRFFLNQAMKKAGLGNDYISMLQPWKQMLDMGLSTFAERPEPTRSDCHAWSASPNYDFLAIIAGIEPGSPGFRTVTISPNMGNLAWIEGKMPVPSGTILFKLRKAGLAGLKGEVTLPYGMSGIFTWNGHPVELTGGVNQIRFQ